MRESHRCGTVMLFVVPDTSVITFKKVSLFAI
jgi:hypothetical protein